MTLIYTDNDHVAEFDRDELKEIFSACDLEILKSEYMHGVQRYWCKVIRHNSTDNSE